jgi:PEP-CTERM motif
VKPSGATSPLSASAASAASDRTTDAQGSVASPFFQNPLQQEPINMHPCRIAALAAACLATTVTVPAQAGLIGETLRFQRLGPTIDVPAGDDRNRTYVISDAIEIQGAFQNTLSIDVQNDALVLVFGNVAFSTVPFVGFSLSDELGNIDNFTALTLSPNSSRPFDASRLSFDADRLWVNLAGMSFARGDRLVFDVAQSTTPPGVPEPASLTLALLGLAGIAAAAKARTAR